MVSFRTFRHPLFPKPVSWFGLFLSLLTARQLYHTIVCLCSVTEILQLNCFLPYFHMTSSFWSRDLFALMSKYYQRYQMIPIKSYLPFAMKSFHEIQDIPVKFEATRSNVMIMKSTRDSVSCLSFYVLPTSCHGV